MTKRLISLLLALIMLLSLCMTSCATTEEEGEEDEEEQVEVQRQNLVLTLYAVKGENMTDEALKLVEEKVSNYCIAKYKTGIDLRFFTEAEYQAGLDEVYDKFAAEAAAKLKAEQEAAAAAKSEAEYKAKLSPEERIEYDQKKRQEAKKKAEEEKKKAEELAEQIEKGEDKAVVKDAQMDLIFIPNGEAYYDNVEKGLLLEMNTYLDNTFKKIRDYIHPAFMYAATVNGNVYGIPNNRDVAADATYFVVNTALAEKYNVDLSAVRSITDFNAAFAAVKAGDPAVTPIYGDFEPEGMTFYEGLDMGHTTCVFNDDLIGGTQMSVNTNAALNPESTASPAMRDYFALKANYRANGYLSDTNQNFFLSVQELSEEERMAWEAKGYTTVLYKGAPITTDAVLNNGLFAVSSHCQYPDRAMEILMLMTTDAELRNLLAFGVEEEHYIVNADNENVITKINNNYDMNFYKTGNSLIGYVTDDMDPDYATKAKAKNLNAYVDPFLGFSYDWETEENKRWVAGFAEFKTYLDPIYQQLCYGIPNWNEVLTEAYGNVHRNEAETFSVSYSSWQSDCTFRSSFKTHAEKLAELRKGLVVEDITEAETPED